MRIHIVGAGPTGLTIAWELAKLKQHEIRVYDKKPGPGGSWWEPDGERRDVHAARAVFPRTFVNTQSLFKEMGLKWSDIFGPGPNASGSLGLKFSAMDYAALVYLSVRVLMSPSTYRHVSLKDALGNELSEQGRITAQNLTYQLDGVPWDVMTAYEFMGTLDWTLLGSIETQKIPGSQMGRMMQGALEAQGVQFFFNSELDKVVYSADGTFHAYFSEDPTEDGILILCPDAVPAKKLIGDNWGPDADAMLTKGAYESVTVMLYYDTELPPLPSGITISMNTALGMLAHALDHKTIAVGLLRPPPEKLDPDQLIEEVVKQLAAVPGMPKLPPLKDSAIGWGSRWVGEKWTHSQSSMVLSTLGPLPFFGTNKRVALCGMMSDRSTPFACIEAAVEVGRRFASQNFGTPKPRSAWTISKILLALIIVWVVLSLGTATSSASLVKAPTR